MKKVLYILIFLCFGFKCTDKICVLDNGKYKVKYDKEFSDYRDFSFLIKDNTLIDLNTDQKLKYTIEWISDNKFRLNSTENQTDTLSDMQKQLNSLGIPFYEIIDCNRDTFRFRFMRNPHITINEGKMVKMD